MQNCREKGTPWSEDISRDPWNRSSRKPHPSFRPSGRPTRGRGCGVAPSNKLIALQIIANFVTVDTLPRPHSIKFRFDCGYVGDMWKNDTNQQQTRASPLLLIIRRCCSHIHSFLRWLEAFIGTRAVRAPQARRGPPLPRKWPVHRRQPRGHQQ